MFSVDVGTCWLHVKSGNHYLVTGLCVIEKTLETAVLYRRINGDETVWCRPHTEFGDGRFVQVEPR